MNDAAFEYLLQRRGPKARNYPGTWELSGGGMLLPGEDPLAGAMRRYQEEMGPLPRVSLTILHEETGVKPSGRRYTTFLAEVPRRFIPDPPDDDVVSGWRWVTVSEAQHAISLHRMTLHPAFEPEFEWAADQER
jgi:8-oxo-dGTP pyrophosphatase MutT (NUDIX family)